MMVTGAVFGWSRWVFIIVPGRVATRTDAEIKHAAADWGRKMFGTDFKIAINVYADRSMAVDVIAKGHPVLDPHYVREMTERWRRWAVEGFGDSTAVECAIASQTDEPRAATLERVS